MTDYFECNIFSVSDVFGEKYNYSLQSKLKKEQ